MPDSPEQLRELQRLMAGALLRPLNARWGMQARTAEGGSMEAWAARLIKPNDRLSSFERLEIYNRQYWFRLLDCLYDDYPGVRELLGERRFMKLATAYLNRYPSRSYSLRDLGNRLERFIRAESGWAQWADWSGPSEEGVQKAKMAAEMARFEWAQVVAFDGASAPPVTPDDLPGNASGAPGQPEPGKIRLGLQPYLSLLDLHYAVDEFSVAIKRDEALRGEASQAVASLPRQASRRRRVKPPARERVRLAVHRFDNVVYFKRLEPEAFEILRALRRGDTLEEACGKGVARGGKKEADWPSRINAWFCEWAQLRWLTAAPN